MIREQVKHFGPVNGLSSWPDKWRVAGSFGAPPFLGLRLKVDPAAAGRCLLPLPAPGTFGSGSTPQSWSSRRAFGLFCPDRIHNCFFT